MSIEKLKVRYPINVQLIYFPLHPETPEGGITLEELFPGRNLNPMKENMKRLMREAGLEYGERSHTFNSRLAQELGKWADTQNEKSEIHDLIYRAYFVEGKNISDMNELLKIAETAGFDRTSAKEILEERSFKLIVDEDWKKSRELGIAGVPTFQNKQHLLVGCQPYEILAHFVHTPTK